MNCGGVGTTFKVNIWVAVPDAFDAVIVTLELPTDAASPVIMPVLVSRPNSEGRLVALKLVGLFVAEI